MCGYCLLGYGGVQCELVALEWHVYGLAAKEDDAVDVSKTPKKMSKPELPREAEDDALMLFFQRLQQRNALCVRGDDASKEEGDLWVFIVNGMQNGVAVEPPAGVQEVDGGVWSGNTQRLPEALSVSIQKQFFAALAAVLGRKLTAQGEFLLADDGFFEPNDAKFVFRSPSLTRLNHLEVYLEEEVPTPAFQLHFRLFQPSNLLAVAVDVVKKERLSTRKLPGAEELGDPRCSWERLLGLPSKNDHSVVDVWHLDDGLVPRILADTKYRDVVPWFRSVTKRKHKRRVDDSDESGGNEEDLGKKDENDEDADDDEDEAAQDADCEPDELLRRPVAGGSAKKKRKRNSADSLENDESIVPVSPDTHVNTPDASGPIIRMTFPHDADLRLRVDPEVRRFKRRRNGSKANKPALSLTFGAITVNGGERGSAKKALPWTLPGNGAKATDLSPAQLFSLVKASLSKPEPMSAKPKNDSKPLSVAVSLVESLSHNEQQEALDGRPVKTHPLLQALQDYVDMEAEASLEESMTNGVSSKVKMLPNAEEYISMKPRKNSGRLSVNRATAEQLQLRLCSERFKHWRSEYKKLQHPKLNRQQKKDRQRQLLLGFDEAEFLEHSREQAVKASSGPERFKLRDSEISLGLQMAASDAMVAWRQEPNGISAWSSHADMNTSAANEWEKKEVADRVQPYLQSLVSALIKEHKNEATRKQWLSFQDYAKASTKPSDATLKRIESVRLEQRPKFCVSTLESSYHVEPAILSEYLLRDLHPVAAPKPVDYVIVCPQSPSQWLASLALSYFTCFRSMYAQCHMGDHAPVGLGQLEGNSYTTVDASNALLLVDCADNVLDAFANFRAAGELLNPVLSSDAKKTAQAFSRSPVGTVVYLVVPFRRSDVKHKMWALGAFSSGLFGANNAVDACSWKGSVTVEMVFLDDLYEVEVNPSPHVLLPNCFGLYDRVCENVNLKRIGSTASGTGCSQFLSERLYHLADWRADTTASSKAIETEPAYSYGGYLLSDDRKWLACSYTDAVGSILETHMIMVEEGDLESALLQMTLKLLQFNALFGSKTVLVITRLADIAGVSHMNDQELRAWEQLQSHRLEDLAPTKYAALVSRLLLVQLSTTSCEEVQFQETLSSSTLYISDRVGFTAISPQDTKTRDRSRITFCTGSEAWKATTLLPDQHALTCKKGSVLQKVSILRDLLEEPDAVVDEAANATAMTAILRDFHALSYLTMHPITMERQSPLPLHLAAISRLDRELQVLQTQLTTDPLQLQ
ncbi:hypothetical protein BBJ28_00014638 [Nothophytophthora sp. Chile5]|nr:hypothetical protein BBJ28_00014638 [Nothophytophthora sp. Chile5]